MVKINLTDKGRKTLTKGRERLENNIKQRLSCLGDNDLEELSVALANVRNILAKVE